jgi:hypothetical protein
MHEVDAVVSSLCRRDHLSVSETAADAKVTVQSAEATIDFLTKFGLAKKIDGHTILSTAFRELED